MKERSIAILVPSLGAGGMERVATLLANSFVENTNDYIHVICINPTKDFFKLNNNVVLHKPKFNPGNHGFFIGAIKTVCYIRNVLKKEKIQYCLSFGDRYNSIFILSTILLKIRITISNRQNPNLSNGILIDLINRIFLPYSDGVIAQTKIAYEKFKDKYKHGNIVVIPNPINQIGRNFNQQRENIVLNVGRFGDLKNQPELVKLFVEINDHEWKLIFIGDGSKLQETDKAIQESGSKVDISIFGFTNEIDNHYNKSSIFAFVSLSEGFPNALAEAMASGCACISYDCIAGPSDLIDDGLNGFLIPVGDTNLYKDRLQMLMQDKKLRERFGKAARKKMKQFEASSISEKYYSFITFQA